MRGIPRAFALRHLAHQANHIAFPPRVPLWADSVIKECGDKVVHDPLDLIAPSGPTPCRACIPLSHLELSLNAILHPTSMILDLSMWKLPLLPLSFFLDSLFTLIVIVVVGSISDFPTHIFDHV